MRLYKCYGKCSEKYEKDKLILHNGKNYCHSCYHQMISENDSRVALYNLIKVHYGVKFPTSMHLAQIKKMKESYTYDDMIIGLNYCVNVLKFRFNPNHGLGYVTNNIEAALYNHKEQKERDKKNNNMFLNSTITHEKVQVASIDETNQLKKSKLINLEDILW